VTHSAKESSKRKEFLPCQYLADAWGFLTMNAQKLSGRDPLVKKYPWWGELSRVNQGDPWASSAVFYAPKAAAGLSQGLAPRPSIRSNQGKLWAKLSWSLRAMNKQINGCQSERTNNLYLRCSIVRHTDPFNFILDGMEASVKVCPHAL
jgi:hypothetical protein